MRLRSYHAILSFLLVAANYLCYGQTWQALNPPLNLFNGSIDVTLFDAAGRLYAGGLFKNTSDKYFVAHWTGGNWTELGGPSALKANGAVITLASHYDTLYAAGAFTNSSGRYYVAKWNGTSWSEVGTGTNALKANDIIYSIASDKAGNVYAAGNFTNATGNYYVAKWNGSTWAELGTGANALNANATIYAVTTDVAGNVYAGGYFTNALGKRYVAMWNGTSWSEVGTGTNALNANDYIRCLATDQNGTVYAGGAFRNGQGEYYLAKWNGLTWTETRSNTSALQANNAINSIATNNKGELYVAGIFTDQSGVYYVAKWNGTSWSSINNPKSPLLAFDRVQSVTVDTNDNICAGGKFKNKSGHSFVAYWDGSSWLELGGKGDPFYASQPIYQIIGDSTGNLYVSGWFHDAGGRDIIHHWNGKGWKVLEVPDTSGLFIHVEGEHSMIVDRKGFLYVTGRKVNADKFYDCILKWDGAQWTILEDSTNALGTYNDNPAYGIGEIEMDDHGNIYVAGGFKDQNNLLYSLAKWDGKTWGRLPVNLAGVQNFCVANDGTIYAYGTFTNNIGRSIIIRYHPERQTTWTEVKNGNSQFSVPGFNVFKNLATDSKNNLYVNGIFTNAAGNRYVAKWDGDAWHEIGPTSSLGVALVVDQGDNIYVNNANDSQYGDPVRKWNGSTWVGLGRPPLSSNPGTGGSVLGADRAGNLYIDAPSDLSGIGSYIAKYTLIPSFSPALSSFTPLKGSTGTTVTISGKNLTGTRTVRFGGTNAASFLIKNDSTLTAVVATGSTGSIVVETLGGTDSLKSFVFTCDSVKGPVPYIWMDRDTILMSSRANTYQWYRNNQPIAGERTNQIVIKSTGFYRVETSTDNVCWVPSLDFPVILSPAPFSDSLKMMVYPNPSSGQFTVYVKLPQTTTANTYVQVVDVNGVQVLQTNRLIFYGNEVRIPLTLNGKGTYFVKVFVNNNTVQQSIIIL